MLEILTQRKYPLVHASEIKNYYNKMYIFLHAFLFDYHICVQAYIVCILHKNRAIDFVQMRATMLRGYYLSRNK
jgi:hypothetical protein